MFSDKPLLRPKNPACAKAEQPARGKFDPHTWRRHLELQIERKRQIVHSLQEAVRDLQKDQIESTRRYQEEQTQLSKLQTMYQDEINQGKQQLRMLGKRLEAAKQESVPIRSGLCSEGLSPDGPQEA